GRAAVPAVPTTAAALGVVRQRRSGVEWLLVGAKLAFREGGAGPFQPFHDARILVPGIALVDGHDDKLYAATYGGTIMRIASPTAAPEQVAVLPRHATELVETVDGGRALLWAFSDSELSMVDPASGKVTSRAADLRRFTGGAAPLFLPGMAADGNGVLVLTPRGLARVGPSGQAH